MNNIFMVCLIFLIALNIVILVKLNRKAKRENKRDEYLRKKDEERQEEHDIAMARIDASDVLNFSEAWPCCGIINCMDKKGRHAGSVRTAKEIQLVARVVRNLEYQKKGGEK